MSNLSYKEPLDESREIIIRKFSKKYHLGNRLKQVCKQKSKGVSNMDVLLFVFSVIFSGKSLYRNIQEMQKNPSDSCFAKDTVYRFLSSCAGWSRLLRAVSADIIHSSIDPLTDNNRKMVIIFDDTAYERARSKKVELLAKTYDHAKKKFSKGFRMLAMGWSDGNSYVPIDFSIISTANTKNRLVESQNREHTDFLNADRQDSRSRAITKATDVFLDMLDTVRSSRISADYVLMDSWFCMPSKIIEVTQKNYDVIGMVKKSKNLRFLYKGKEVSARNIYRNGKKRRGLAHVKLSVMVQVYNRDRSCYIPAKLVFVAQYSNRKNWLVLLSTDTKLSDESIIQLYGRRWSTEVFFKICKSYLNLAKGCQCRNFDSINTHTAIVYLQYMMLAEQQRFQVDDRSIGDLFYLVVDQLQELSFEEALHSLLDTLFNAITQKLNLSEIDQVKLTQVFMRTVPQLFSAKMKMTS